MSRACHIVSVLLIYGLNLDSREMIADLDYVNHKSYVIMWLIMSGKYQTQLIAVVCSFTMTLHFCAQEGGNFLCFNKQAHYLMNKSIYLYYLNIIFKSWVFFFSVCLKHCVLYTILISISWKKHFLIHYKVVKCMTFLSWPLALSKFPCVFGSYGIWHH